VRLRLGVQLRRERAARRALWRRDQAMEREPILGVQTR
jgi:hypothetical protein